MSDLADKPALSPRPSAVRAPKHAAALARARACGSSNDAANVISNLLADAYARPEDIEADLSALEKGLQS